MIVSANSQPDKSEFNHLLKTTLSQLNLHAKKSAKDITLLTGNRLEPFIKDILTEQAVGTAFENSIELISGQKFPDIIAKRYYGIEVKSTTQNHWKTTGNSVLESTRVEGVERIFMLFGKLGKPIEFRCRPYEECLSEVVVTHSPRYLIDMNLQKGATIFDKMNVSYDTLRTKPNPIRPVVEYYKSKRQKGEEVWWMDQENEKSNSFLIRIWNNLETIEKNKIRISVMSFFPEIFGNDNRNKFNRLPAWLVTHHSVVCKNVRDLFTAGGKSDVTVGVKIYKNIPRILATLIHHLPSIVEVIIRTPAIELSEYWQHKTSERSKLNDWITLVAIEAKKIPDAKHIDIRDIVSHALPHLHAIT